MMCEAYFGELSEQRKEKWNYEDSNPYSVLNSPIKLFGKGHAILSTGSKYFHDKISVDWGSYAWKCSGDEILRFLLNHKSNLPWLIEDDNRLFEEVKSYISKSDDTVFGIVFIEEC